MTAAENSLLLPRAGLDTPARVSCGAEGAWVATVASSAIRLPPGLWRGLKARVRTFCIPEMETMTRARA
jgi:hypothetical protein